MWPFRRRSRTGRHQLGAAVTAIPALPRPTDPVLSPYVDPPAPVVPAQAPSTVPRVELGFRDGSTASLAPGSEQARALSDLASMLTQRNPVKGS